MVYAAGFFVPVTGYLRRGIECLVDIGNNVRDIFDTDGIVMVYVK
jgi:hypothetical protein